MARLVRMLRDSAGFTLIELTFALALGGAAVLGVLALR